jgi:hypothetical protein
MLAANSGLVSPAQLWCDHPARSRVGRGEQRPDSATHPGSAPRSGLSRRGRRGRRDGRDNQHAGFCVAIRAARARRPACGLYDDADEAKLRHGLAAAGLGAALEPDGLSGLGFYKCSADLEDELIRALGVEAVEAIIEAEGEANSLRLLAGMPAQRDRTREAVLRRFLGVRSGRKARYATLLVEALEPGRVPEPLAAVLARV